MRRKYSEYKLLPGFQMWLLSKFCLFVFLLVICCCCVYLFVLCLVFSLVEWRDSQENG